MVAGASHRPTRVVGRYAMYEQFASGGMATVHYGRLVGTAGFSRIVAIKKLHANLSDNPAFVTMFLDEARLAARIQHPNVVQTLDVVSFEGELFVVLDYVHGESLSRLLGEAKRSGDAPSSSLVGAIIFQVLEGLHAAHEARDPKGEPMELVHRDVSPHNLLVGADGIARVLDFGIAKARGRAQTTRSGELKGKLAYMAPEQFRGQATRRSDVFAASIVLWEALTGTYLFRGEGEAETVDRLLHRHIQSPRELRETVTPELEAIVMRGLERDPSKRYATAREMAIALQEQGELATPIEVGAWVHRLAGSTLEQRAKRVTSIEASDASTNESALLSSETVDTNVDVVSSASRLSVGGRASATLPTAAVPGLARRADPVERDAGAKSAGAGIATVPEVRAPRGRRWTRTWSLVGAITVTSLGIFLQLRRAAEVAIPDGPKVTATAPPGVATTPQEVATAPQEAPAASPAESSTTAPSAAWRGPRAVQPLPAVPKKAPAVIPVRKSADCSTAYTSDARGVRHYKPECL